VLAVALAIISFSCALWLCYMIRYPLRWDARVDGLHSRLSSVGLSMAWMKAMEKGAVLKIVVAVLTMVTLACLAILMEHPNALQVFWQNYPKKFLQEG
jgi:hypothetical protein